MLCVDCGEDRKVVRRLCSRCYQRRTRRGLPLPERTRLGFRDHLADVAGRDPDQCWDWPGTIGANGYGLVGIGDRRHLSHRAVYEALIGPIPDGLTLDHLCRNTRCCNPAHLDPCTTQENTRRSPRTLTGANIRKTHCPQGHPYVGRNLLLDRGKRKCRTCVYARNRRADRQRRLDQAVAS